MRRPESRFSQWLGRASPSLWIGWLLAMVLIVGVLAGGYFYAAGWGRHAPEIESMGVICRQPREPGKTAGLIGQPGRESEVTRRVVLELKDEMRFNPSFIRVSAGETVRFEVRNVGKLRHELVIAGEDELDTHAKAMRLNPRMKHDHHNMVHVAPGESRHIIWRFTHAGIVPFACLQPGHFEAGMQGKVLVSAE